MQSISLTIARLCLAGWVGAAALFVVAGVREQVSPEFDSATKAALAALRFPPYYAFGFALTAIGLAAGCLGLRDAGRARRWAFLGTLLVAIGLMVADYVWIYRPLEAMMLAADQVRPAEFRWYHEVSKYINLADFTLCFVAACLVCWPTRRR